MNNECENKKNINKQPLTCPTSTSLRCENAFDECENPLYHVGIQNTNANISVSNTNANACKFKIEGQTITTVDDVENITTSGPTCVGCEESLEFIGLNGINVSIDDVMPNSSDANNMCITLNIGFTEQLNEILTLNKINNCSNLSLLYPLNDIGIPSIEAYTLNLQIFINEINLECLNCNDREIVANFVKNHALGIPSFLDANYNLWANDQNGSLNPVFSTFTDFKNSLLNGCL